MSSDLLDRPLRSLTGCPRPRNRPAAIAWCHALRPICCTAVEVVVVLRAQPGGPERLGEADEDDRQRTKQTSTRPTAAAAVRQGTAGRWGRSHDVDARGPEVEQSRDSDAQRHHGDRASEPRREAAYDQQQRGARDSDDQRGRVGVGQRPQHAEKRRRSSFPRDPGRQGGSGSGRRSGHSPNENWSPAPRRTAASPS